MQHMNKKKKLDALVHRSSLSICRQGIEDNESWTTKACKCDCEAEESTTETTSSIVPGSVWIQEMHCMPGEMREKNIWEEIIRYRQSNIWDTQ